MFFFYKKLIFQMVVRTWKDHSNFLIYSLINIFVKVARTIKEESTGKKSKPLNVFKSFFFKGDFEASL